MKDHWSSAAAVTWCFLIWWIRKCRMLRGNKYYHAGTVLLLPAPITYPGIPNGSTNASWTPNRSSEALSVTWVSKRIQNVPFSDFWLKVSVHGGYAEVWFLSIYSPVMGYLVQTFSVLFREITCGVSSITGLVNSDANVILLFFSLLNWPVNLV